MIETADRLAPVLDWLHREGRLMPNMGRFVDQLMLRAVAVGMPIWRFYIGLQLVHPQMLATGFLWRRGIGLEETQRAHGIQNTAAYIGSPMKEARDENRIVRYNLTALPASAHEMLHDLRVGQGTDYIAFPLRVSREGPSPIASFATDREGGFDAQDLADLQRLVDGMGAVAEIYIQRSIAETVVKTYLGRQVGQRILSGAIRRGDGEEINAVLWFSDLRDFTGLNERLPAADLLELLNNYLQLVGDALDAHGGEILKFIGDGVMGYFPAEDALFLPMITANALAAARRLIEDVEAANFARATGGRDPLRFGIGLHIGPVTFGNIGTRDRLDFTVLGPAVNRAARLEALTKELKVLVCASADFKEACTQPLVSLGRHVLRGVAEPVEVFTIP